MSARVRIVFAGAWLGVLQAAFFFELTLRCSSSFIAYAAELLSWLLGSVAGVWIFGRRSTRPLVIVAALAPYAVHLLFAAFPYSLGALPVAALAIAAAGIFAGHLFQTERESAAGIDKLFFLEGVGFLAGLFASTIVTLTLGRAFLLYGPAIGGAVLVASYTYRAPTVSAARSPVTKKKKGARSR